VNSLLPVAHLKKQKIQIRFLQNSATFVDFGGFFIFIAIDFTPF
jgi:hypothetical protein